MCHSTAKRETAAISTVSSKILPGSIHRKRITITFCGPKPKPASLIAAIGANTPFNVNLVPPAGYSVQLLGLSINDTVAWTSTLTIKDGATNIAFYNISIPANAADTPIPVPAGGILASDGNTMNIVTGNSPAASSGNMSVDAIFIPSQTPRVSFSPDNPAILDMGLTIESINDVTVLDEHMIGDWINRELFAISNCQIQLSIVDIAERGPFQGAHLGQDADLISQVQEYNPHRRH